MRRFLIATAAVAALALATPASAQAPIVLKFSHVVAPDTPKGKGVDEIARFIEQKGGLGA